jgi:hypothetical protein
MYRSLDRLLFAGKARLEGDILAFDITEITKLLPECRPPLQAFARI